MDVTELSNFWYEENHSPFYVKYNILSGDFLEQKIKQSGLVKSNFTIQFNEKFVYFDKKQAEEIISNIHNFEEIGLLLQFARDHLSLLEKTKLWAQEKTRNGIQHLVKLHGLLNGTSSYDFLIHLIWSEKANYIVKKYNLPRYRFFELSCPAKTMASETKLTILKLVCDGKLDLLRKNYGWIPNLFEFEKMSKENAKKDLESMRQEILRKEEIHKANINGIEESILKNWINTFNELQKWVNNVDFLEREIDHHFFELYKNISKELSLDTNEIELVKNLTCEELLEYESGQKSVSDLKFSFAKRKKSYEIIYRNEKITINDI